MEIIILLKLETLLNLGLLCVRLRSLHMSSEGIFLLKYEKRYIIESSSWIQLLLERRGRIYKIVSARR